MTEDVIRYSYVMIRHDSRELLSNDASLQRYKYKYKYIYVCVYIHIIQTVLRQEKRNWWELPLKLSPYGPGDFEQKTISITAGGRRHLLIITQGMLPSISPDHLVIICDEILKIEIFEFRVIVTIGME